MHRMTQVVTLSTTSWHGGCTSAEQQRAIDALEHGNVLLLHLPFVPSDDETQLLTPAVGGDGKNVNFDPRTGAIRGSQAQGHQLEVLRAMMRRFARDSDALIHSLLAHYGSGLRATRTSFRPIEIAGRTSSWRKDDTRLHVDSFPSTPTGGARILRVFSNINPAGATRKWRLGEPFENVAQRYAPTLSTPIPGVNVLLEHLGITKSRRSAYDHFMLQLHDRMKADLDYQAHAPQSVFEFQAGTSWIVFTDQTSHAATSGQYALEQTFRVPLECMRDPSLAPLSVLERLLGRHLT